MPHGMEPFRRQSSHGVSEQSDPQNRATLCGAPALPSAKCTLQSAARVHSVAFFNSVVLFCTSANLLATPIPGHSMHSATPLTHPTLSALLPPTRPLGPHSAYSATPLTPSYSVYSTPATPYPPRAPLRPLRHSTNSVYSVALRGTQWLIQLS